MAGSWEPVNKDDDGNAFFGEVDAIVFSDKDSGPAELRYKGGAADIYEDVPEAAPAPTRKQRRSEGVWSPDAKDVKQKKRKNKNSTSRVLLRRAVPLLTVIIVFGVMGALFFGVAKLLQGGG